MRFITKLTMAIIVTMIPISVFAQDENDNASSEAEELKIAALEALLGAPEERALPLLAKVLAGNSSDEVKSRALFVLSQIDLPEAQSVLLDTAKSGSGELRLEAIRMIGISGDPDALAGLSDLYQGGDMEVKESVLHAYLIADDANAVYELAASATSDEEFESAVNILGAMDARDELRKLRDHKGNSESLIHAYAMSGDSESLRVLAIDGNNPEQQMQAIHGLGIVGGDEVNTMLLEIYRGSDSPEIKDAALHGMMMADYDEGVLDLFRSSDDAAEKRELLQMLVMMDSEAAFEVIDAALAGDES